MPEEKQTAKNLQIVPDSREQLPREIEEPEVCPTCFGTGMEIVPDKGARPCHCRQKSIPKLSEKARIPQRYGDKDFHNYTRYNDSQKEAYLYAHRLAKDYPAVDRGLLFMGPVGVGKTHLAVSIMKGLIERGIPCLFYEFVSLIKEIQGSYNSNTNTSEYGILAPVFNVDVLVLDELGASKATDWVKDTLSNIINTRYNDKKLTIFTTNYLDSKTADDIVNKEYVANKMLMAVNGDEIRVNSLKRQIASYSDYEWATLLRQEQERYLATNETLDERIGIRLRSRLFEMCKTVVIDGEDYRRNADKRNFSTQTS